jgi:hypothetical protein
MPKASRILIGAVVAGAAAYGVYAAGTSLLGSSDDDTASARHLANQVWIERMPQGERDMIGHLGFVDHPRGKMGWVGRSSQWRHFAELFHWSIKGDEVSLYLPQEEVRGKLHARTWKCKGEAPRPFELCLELSANGRKMRYYSMKDWVIEPHHAEESLAAIEERVPELAGMFDHTVSDDVFEDSEAVSATEITDEDLPELRDLSLFGAP